MIVTSPILLLEKMLNVVRSKSLYIFGAGASYQYIPISYDLVNEAKNLVSNIVQDISIIKTSLCNEIEKSRFEINGHLIHEDFHGNILIDETDKNLSDIYIKQYPEIVSFYGMLTYSLNDLPKRCPEYEFFNKVNPSSVFLNMNHDNLCENFLSNKKVITLHGSVPIGLKSKIKKNIDYILDDSRGSRIRDFIPDKLYVSTRELEASLLKNHEYKELINTLRKNNFSCLVIIGYSFFKKNSYEIYDTFTYDLIRSFLYKNKNNCEIIIIDPEPDYVADMLHKTLFISEISLYKIRWDCFTNAFFDLVKNKNLQNLNLSEFELRIFSNIYNHYKHLGRWPIKLRS